MAQLTPYEKGSCHFRVDTSKHELTINDKHNRIGRDEVEVWDWTRHPRKHLGDFENLAQAIVFVEGVIGERVELPNE